MPVCRRVGGKAKKGKYREKVGITSSGGAQHHSLNHHLIKSSLKEIIAILTG